MNIIGGFFKFVIGFTLGLTILVGGSAAAIYYFWINKTTMTPPKPIFDEETVTKKKNQTAAKIVRKESSLYKARIIAIKGVSLRSEPNINADQVGGILYNEEVTIIEETPEKNWVKIKGKEKDQIGWVKMRNIEKIEPNKNKEKNENDIKG